MLSLRNMGHGILTNCQTMPLTGSVLSGLRLATFKTTSASKTETTNQSHT